MKHEQEPQLSVEEMFYQLEQLSNEEWAIYAFSKEPLNGKVPANLRQELIGKAIQSGQEQAQICMKQFGQEDVLKVCEHLKLQVEMPDMPSGGGHVIFGQYIEPNQIILYQDCLKKVQSLLDNNDIPITLTQIHDILLMHEVYHHLEYVNQHTLFTRTYRLKLWKFLHYTHTSPLYCLGEIAAMIFAQSYLKLSFSPNILDVLLVCAYDIDSGRAIYQNIMNVLRGGEYASKSTND